MSAKNTYMKFDFMRLSHMRVKWNEIRYMYIPICYQFFAGWEDLVLIIHIRTLRNLWFKNVFSCVRRFSTDLCQFYTSGKNHTSSSQTLHKFVPSETEKNTNRQ